VRARWFFDEEAFTNYETAVPTLYHRGIDLAIGSAERSGSLPGGTRSATRQAGNDHAARIQEVRSHVVVERRHDLQAAPTPPPSLFYKVFAIEFTKPPDATVVRPPLTAAASRTAVLRLRWYAPGGCLPGLRSEPGKPAPEAFSLPRSLVPDA
jgi:hypothetical protein